MNYTFPKITHFDDIRDALDDRFVVAQRDGHIVVCYVVNMRDTFPPIENEAAKMRREFRGLVFCSKTGNLIRRPFQKFFNVNEREEVELGNIDVSKKHVILEKLDGSMIVPYKVGSELIWGTKMGKTFVSDQVDKFVEKNPNYFKFANTWTIGGYSVIFEWCSRQNRIVVDYPSDRLVLTAIRNRESGEYLTYESMIREAKYDNIEVVDAIEGRLDFDLLNRVHDMNGDQEGFVIRFDEGHMVKIKTDAYVKLHKAKEAICYEHDVVTMILSGLTDDAKPVLSKFDRDRLEIFEEALLSEVRAEALRILIAIRLVRDYRLSRREFATDESIAETLQSYHKDLILRFYDKEVSISDLEPLIIEVFLHQAYRRNRWLTFKQETLKNLMNWIEVNVTEDS